jgi:hypothetical protein
MKGKRERKRKNEVSVSQSHFNCALLIKTMERPCNKRTRTMDDAEREGELEGTEREGGSMRGGGREKRRKGKERGKGSGRGRGEIERVDRR